VAEYKVLVKPSAGKEIEAVGTKADRQRIIETIQSLSTDPRAEGCEKLAGYADRYRVRQGQYRIVYIIDDKLHEVTIFMVRHRKDVYR